MDLDPDRKQAHLPHLTKIENILTHWSVDQTDSNNEKMEVENLVGLSL